MALKNVTIKRKGKKKKNIENPPNVAGTFKAKYISIINMKNPNPKFKGVIFLPVILPLPIFMLSFFWFFSF